MTTNAFFFFCSGFGKMLFDAQFLGDVFGQCILMNKDIHGFVSNESFGSIPDAFILAAQSPGVLYHEIFFSVLVFGNAVDNHAVVIGCFPVVESSLTHFLGNVDFRQRFAGQLFALVGSGKACPTSHVRTGEFCAAGCGGNNQ